MKKLMLTGGIGEPGLIGQLGRIVAAGAGSHPIASSAIYVPRRKGSGVAKKYSERPGVTLLKTTDECPWCESRNIQLWHGHVRCKDCGKHSPIMDRK